MYTPGYTTYEDVVRTLGASKLQIKIGYDPSDHISEPDIRNTIRDAERLLTAELAKVYLMPIVPFDNGVPTWVRDTLATVALYKACVAIWDAAPGVAVGGEPRPATVLAWERNAKQLLESILKREMALTGLAMTGVESMVPLTDRDTTVLYDTVRGPDAEAVDQPGVTPIESDEDTVLDGNI